MAEIVSIHATSHTPVMINFPDAIPSQDREEIFAAFRQVGEEILAARPDAVVVISDDHVHNFFMNNFPAFCIGGIAPATLPEVLAAGARRIAAVNWTEADGSTLRPLAGLIFADAG